jgi:hypothetical protein
MPRVAFEPPDAIVHDRATGITERAGIDLAHGMHVAVDRLVLA